jgi:hypothetical protein
VTELVASAPRSIDQNHTIGALASANIDIFAKLDVALAPGNCQSPIAPIRQGIGRKPVHANIAACGVRAQIQLPQILQPGVIRIATIGNKRVGDLGVSRPRVMQKLIDLVRRNVGQNTTVAITLKEPRRPRRAVKSVRPKSNRLNNPP